MNWPAASELQKLLDLLDRHAPDLAPVCRWLAISPAIGPRRAAVLLADHARRPAADDLLRFLRLVEQRAPGLVPLAYWLAEGSEHADEVWVEIQLDRLLAADVDAWEHPTQVLERPWPAFAALLDSCTARRRRARGDRRQRLAQVEAKLERAVRIAAAAERRRARMRRRKQSPRATSVHEE